MAYNEANYVQRLINQYRAQPNLFDDDQLDVLQQKANEYNISFKPLRDTTTLSSVVQNFSSGFIRGLFPLVPPDNKPRTTYEAIAQSLGHLAGFAPSILSMPLRGATTGLRAVATAAGMTKTAKKLTDIQGAAGTGFIGMNVVTVLDKASFPMMASRFAKRGLNKSFSKLEGDALEYFRPGTAARAITEEAIGLGAASTISNVWAGPDEYINSFVGGAIAGGAFGGIGNYISIANRLKFGTEVQRKNAEKALRAALGASFTGVPSTLRDDPIEMQLYEYLLGGFFGYNARPAHEAVGGAHFAGMNSLNKSLSLRPEKSEGFSDLAPKAQEYVLQKSTEQAKAWLSRHDYLYEGVDIRNVIGERLRKEHFNPTQKQIDKEYRDFAYEEYTKIVDKMPEMELKTKLDDNTHPDNRTDWVDDYNPFSVSFDVISRGMLRDIKSHSGKYNNDFTGIKKELNNFLSRNIFEVDPNTNIVDPYTKRSAPDVETFINTLKNHESYSRLFQPEYKKQNKVNTDYETELRRLFFQAAQLPNKTQTFDGKNVETQMPERIDFEQLGVNHFNSPILDTFGAGRGFEFLHYFKKDVPTGFWKNFKKNILFKNTEHKDLVDIFTKVNNEYVDKNQINNLFTSLAKQNKYVYAGSKDKGHVITASFNDRNGAIKLESILNTTNFKDKELTQFRKDYKDSLNEFKKMYTGIRPESLHERIVVSNLRHELTNHNYPTDTQGNFFRNDIRKVVGTQEYKKNGKDSYFQNAVDYNKRMQGFIEASGVPMNRTSFLESLPDGKIKYLVVKDIDFDPYPNFVKSKWSRFGLAGEEKYEVSTQGDKRFSALNAKLEDGRSIEQHYQVDVKGYNSIKEGKGRRPKNKDIDLYGEYKKLWDRWADLNPNLMKELAIKSANKTLTDMYAATNVSQARALSEILNERKLIAKPSSATDGGRFFRQKVFADIIRALGFPKSFDNVKPVSFGLPDTGSHGLFFHKTGGKRATGAIEDLINRAGVDYIVFESGSKIRGAENITRVDYDPVNNKYNFKKTEYETIENGVLVKKQRDIINTHSADIETLRMNPSTFEDAGKGSRGTFIPIQFFKTLTKEDTPQAYKNFIKHYYRTPRFEQELVNEFNNTKDFTKIENHLNKDYSNIDRFPLDFVIEQLSNTGKQGQAFRKALQKVAKDDAPFTSSFVNKGDERFDFYHEKNNNWNFLNQGQFAGSAIAAQARNSYLNSVSKYFKKRATSPFWEYGGKGWLNPVTKDIALTSDMINNRQLKQGEVLLDLGYKPMKTILNDLKELDRKRLNYIITRLKDVKNKKQINKDNESNLGTLWETYKYLKKTNSSPDLAKTLENTFDLLVIRVPSDAVSGTRVLRFKGFTKQKGTGINTHKKDDAYLGGADKDADSAFIIQGGERNHIIELNKKNVKLERENKWNLKEDKDYDRLDKQLGAEKPKIGSFSKFSPSFRMKAFEIGKEGANVRGGFIAMRDAMYDLYLNVQGGKNLYIFEKDTGKKTGIYFDKENNQYIKSKKGVGRQKYDEEIFELKIKPEGITEFRKKVFGLINIANDSTKYTKIPDIYKAKADLLNTLFTAKDLKGKRIDFKDLIKYDKEYTNFKDVLNTADIAKISKERGDKNDVIKIKHNDKDITLPTKQFIGEVMRFDKNLFNTLKQRKLLVEGPRGLEINRQKVLKYKDIENFHKTFKKDKVAQNKKSIDYLRELKMDFDYSGNYQSPTGQQFKNAFKNDPVLYKIENAEKATTFQNNLRTDVERFSKSNNDKKFLEKLIDITKDPILKFQDTTSGRKSYLFGLDTLAPATIRKISKNTKNNFFSDLDVNMKKISGYELLTERSLEVFESFSPSKQKNYDKISEQLGKIYKKANEIKQSHNDTSNPNRGKRFDTKDNLEKHETGNRYEITDGQIRDYKKVILEFAKNNNVDAIPLIKFFDTALLIPYKVGKKNKYVDFPTIYRIDKDGKSKPEKKVEMVDFYRPNDHFFSSYEVGAVAKKNMLDRMQLLFEKSDANLQPGFKQQTIQFPVFEPIRQYFKPLAEKYTEIVSNPDKAKSIADDVLSKTKKGATQYEKDNLDILAFDNKDFQSIKEFRENIKRYPAIDSINDYFMEYSYRHQGVAKDISKMSISDIKSMNENFKWIESKQKDKFKWLTWLRDPRDISERDLAPSMVKIYDNFLSPVRTAKGIEQKKLARFISPLGEMREAFKNVRLLQDKTLNMDNEKLAKEFEFTSLLNANDKVTLTELISNKRNIEEPRLTGKKYTDFLKKEFNFKEPIKNESGVNQRKWNGQELFNKYDKATTEFYERMGKEYIYTYDKNDKRIIFDDIIDIKNPTFGKLNENIQYDKNGRFNLEHFYKKLLTIKNNKLPEGISLEQLLRYQYEYSMEKDLLIKNKNKKPTLQQRIDYRLKNNFTKQMGIGRIEPSEYWSRLNYGHNTESRKVMQESIEKYARQQAESIGGTKEKIEKEYQKIVEQLLQAREKSLNNSARFEDAFLDKQYENVGFGSRPPNLLQRGEIFIDGYDKTPNTFSSYNQRTIRSLFSNISAIYGNRQIDLFRKNKAMDKHFQISDDIKKHNLEVEVQANALYKKIIAEGTKKNIAERKRTEYINRNEYKNNTDMWADFLYIYLKNSLGHPSLLTNRIQKSIAGADPLKLKFNPYYFTSDYAVTKALERLYKTDKFNKMPFLRNAPEGKEARRDYFVRRLHDLGALEARFNLMTILANTGTMSTNLYGGAAMNIGSAGLKNFVDSKKEKDINGEFVIKLKNGKRVKTRKDLIKYLQEEGIIDNYLAQADLEYNVGLKQGIDKLGANAKNFIKDIKNTMKSNNNENAKDVVQRYGISDTMTKYGGLFMQFSERVNRTDAFISHALQAKENLGRHGIHVNMKDPYIFDAGLKGIETTQFLYHNSFRPAFMTTALGKVLTRFKLFAFQSVRVRQEFYRKAKSYGLKEGTPEYKRYKDLFLIDMFTMAMAGAYMYSIFDTALPPPYDWYQDTADLLFGDKIERDRAFYGTLPRPIAPLQAALPPITRVPGSIVELISGDWQKFSDYTIHTMYPFGRLVYTGKKQAENPERFFENFFRIPVNKVKYRIKREDILEKRKDAINAYLSDDEE
jgi:hypothetical protein